MSGKGREAARAVAVQEDSKEEEKQERADSRLINSRPRLSSPPILSQSSFSAELSVWSLDASAYWARMPVLSVLGSFLARDARCSGEWSCCETRCGE